MDIQHAAAVAKAGDRSSSSTCSQFSQPPLQKNTDNTDVATSFVANLCDDTLLRILSYADLRSLVYFTQCTSSSLRHRFNHSSSTTTVTNDGGLDTVEKTNSWNNRCPDIWQEVFVNHNFAPVDNSNATNNNNALCLRRHEEGREFGIQPIPTIDYYNAIRERLSLWSNLNGNSALRKRCCKATSSLALRSKKAHTKQCFSLPNRYFHFVPILPPDMMQYPPLLQAGDTNNVNNDMSFSFVEDDEDNNGIQMNNNSYEILEDQEEQDHPIDNELDDTLGHYIHLDDPPPVEFACDSFCLTSPSTGAEYVLLNPFSGSVEVYDNVLDNAISSDESLMELALLDASESIIQKRRSYNTQQHGVRKENDRHADLDESSEVIAGEAIHNRFHLNHKMYDTPPKQVLFSVNDYFDLDLNEYFGEHTPFAAISNRRDRRGNVTVDWVGVDSHIALQKNDSKSIAGNIIGAARILTMESLDHAEEELECTEIFAWSNFERETDASCSSSYDIKYVCRAAGSFYFLDIDANYGKLYAAFQSGCCPFVDRDINAANLRRDEQLSNHMQLEEESVVNDDGQPIRLQKAIYCLPLLRYDETPCTPEAIGSYFPTPDACILAQYPVSSFSCDPTGKLLLVGTNCGTVEIWHTGMDSHNISPTAPQRLQVLSVHESFMKRHRSITMDGRHSSKNEVDATANELFDNKPPNNIEFDNNATETQDDLALLENVEDEFPHKHPTTKVSQIYLSRHLPLHQARCFITKQRNPELGTTLLLWQTSTISSETSIQDSIHMQYHITAMINLPLSTQCHPEVHFDGRRVIVYGKDHIGQILLVYHVLSTRHDQDEFDEANAIKSPKKKSSSKTNNGEESGGVINISEEQRIKFVNRIRHAGLGGIQYYDAMLLSANERFLICNTKAGNLVGSDGTRNASEGLLVIDLQEYDH